MTSLCMMPRSSWAKKEPIVSLVPTTTFKGNVSFDSVDVVDLRLQKDKLGEVNGTFMKRLPVTTQDSLSVSLTRFAHQIVDSAAVKQNNRLLILVHDLKFHDKAQKNQNICTIYLDADCYLADGKGYHRMLAIDSLYDYAAPRDKDMIETLSDNLSYLFTMMVSNMAMVKEMNSPTQSLEEILIQNTGKRNNFPVYKEPHRAGIYYTLKQFLDNTPADTNFIHDRFCPGSYCYERFYIPTKKELRYKGKNLADTTCFAIYDNGKWYRPYTKTDFKEMSFINGDFYYQSVQKGVHVEDYNSLRRTGFQLASLGSVLTATPPTTLEEMQYVNPPKFKDAVYSIRLNPATGNGVRVERIE